MSSKHNVGCLKIGYIPWYSHIRRLIIFHTQTAILESFRSFSPMDTSISPLQVASLKQIARSHVADGELCHLAFLVEGQTWKWTPNGRIVPSTCGTLRDHPCRGRPTLLSRSHGLEAARTQKLSTQLSSLNSFDSFEPNQSVYGIISWSIFSWSQDPTTSLRRILKLNPRGVAKNQFRVAACHRETEPRTFRMEWFFHIACNNRTWQGTIPSVYIHLMIFHLNNLLFPLPWFLVYLLCTRLLRNLPNFEFEKWISLFCALQFLAWWPV